jgi:hypothetical protein
VELHEELKERRRLKRTLDDAHKDFKGHKLDRDKAKAAKKLAKQESRRLRDERKKAA